MTKARCRTDRRQLALAHTHDSLSTPTIPCPPPRLTMVRVARSGR